VKQILAKSEQLVVLSTARLTALDFQKLLPEQREAEKSINELQKKQIEKVNEVVRQLEAV
jgi:hypothetical protein